MPHCSSLVWLTLVSQVLLVSAQSLVPSSSWRKPNITISKQDRVSIAASALDLAIVSLGPDLTYLNTESPDAGLRGTARLHMQLAAFDSASNTTRYQYRVQQFYSQRGDGTANLSDPSAVGPAGLLYFLLYGYGACRAYMTYKNPAFLLTAESVWSRLNNQTVTDNLNCDTQHFAYNGGLIGTSTENGTLFRGYENGLYLILSGLLSDITSNATYWSAAQSTEDFIQRNMYPHPGTVEPIIISNCSKRFKDELLSTEDTAIVIQGLSIFESIQRKRGDSGSDDTAKQLRQAVSAATTRVGSWIQEDGVMKPSAGYTAHALGYTYEHTPDTEMKSYIQSFLSVQYNSILDQARTPGGNEYGDWIGPPASFFDSSKQTSACQALIAAISLPEQSNVTNSTSDTPGKSRRFNVGAIAGGVVAGVVLLVVILAIVVMLIRRRKRRFEESGISRPFTAREPTSVQTSTKGFGGSSGQPSNSTSEAHSNVSPPAYEDLTGRM
ncbi:hypothetical protein VNI00_007254 [Paramarasmius palmivorus]|uniref:Glycoside hydrolase family 76 protein n=1 Tax=Paramarasmius palmivorus TaxID=297713 RepID=A0AAW0D3V5_9AGAR